MREYIEQVLRKEDLSFEEMQEASRIILDESTDMQLIKQFLIALAIKGETANEVAALATVIKSFAMTLNVPEGNYMDNCGTGGDGSNSFNISTASAIVIAGAGVSIAKHGNRKISSSSGSTDVLEALGIQTNLDIQASLNILNKEGITFLYAPTVHPKLKRIGLVRQQIGKPTIFNLVGPLTNPVPLLSQYTGINRPDFTIEYAKVLHMLGRERAIVVCGTGGMDEASLVGKNSLVLVEKGDLIPFTLSPEDVGLSFYSPAAVRGGTAEENAQIMLNLLNGKQDAYFDSVIFNAGIGLYANGAVNNIPEGVKLAKDSILSGKALYKLKAVVAYSNPNFAQEVLS